jgi:hypothetical protein
MIYAITSGINDYGGERDLQFAAGDATRLAKTLENNKSNVKLVDNLINSDATHTNIIKKIKEVSKYLKSNDTLLFTYSGHGAQIKDLNSDESDGLDEVLCTYGFDWKDNLLSDDTISDLSSFIPDNCGFELILDCCHSGTATKGLDKYIRSLKNPNIREYSQDTKMIKSSISKPKNKNIVLWSGCKDAEYSYEDYFEDINNGSGLLTYYYIKALENSNMGITARRSSIHSYIKNSIKDLKKYPQNPQLECGFLKKFARVFTA